MLPFLIANGLFSYRDYYSARKSGYYNKVKMQLSEKEVEIDGVKMREVRKLNAQGHQTSVLTTHRKLSMVLIALYMFSRWAQENFFRYMRQEYDIDRIIQYGVSEIDSNIMVVNREYSNLTYQIKKVRERISMHQAKLYTLIEENVHTEMEQTSQNLKQQMELRQPIESLQQQYQSLIETRKNKPYKISIGQMPQNTRYNKLNTESKYLQNIIKIICYRAETAFANTMASCYSKNRDEIRAQVKSVIFSKADLIPDEVNKTLTIKLYSLATKRDNLAVQKDCDLLNDTETIFPGTNMTLVFKTATT